MRAYVISFTVVALAACAQVPDVVFDDDAGLAGNGNGDGGPGLVDGAGIVDGSGVDTGMPSVDSGPCTASGAEICNDGIDNDCNGKMDCQDPACTAGFQCVPAPPSGWGLVAYSESTPAPACPAGFGAASTIEAVSGDGSGGCSATCTTTGPLCSAGSFTVAVSGAPDCTGGTPATEVVSSNAAACTALGGAITVPNAPAYGKVTPPTGPTSCSPNYTKTIPPVVSALSCGAPAKLGGGCLGGQVCAPIATGNGFQMCATMAGNMTCPATNYTKRHRTGSADADTRDCSATCNNVPCGGSVSIFSNSNCMGGKSDTINANDTCTQLVDSNFPGGASNFKSSVTGGCTLAGTATQIGTLSFTGETTYCCK